jgi:hypothetical protein
MLKQLPLSPFSFDSHAFIRQTKATSIFITHVEMKVDMLHTLKIYDLSHNSLHVIVLLNVLSKAAILSDVSRNCIKVRLLSLWKPPRCVYCAVNFTY